MPQVDCLDRASSQPLSGQEASSDNRLQLEKLEWAEAREKNSTKCFPNILNMLAQLPTKTKWVWTERRMLKQQILRDNYSTWVIWTHSNKVSSCASILQGFVCGLPLASMLKHWTRLISSSWASKQTLRLSEDMRSHTSSLQDVRNTCFKWKILCRRLEKSSLENMK